MGEDELVHARSELQTAAEQAESSVKEQLESVDEGLMEMIEGDKTQDAPVHGDRLAELVDKLDELERKTDHEAARRHIADATESVESARRSGHGDEA